FLIQSFYIFLLCKFTDLFFVVLFFFKEKSLSKTEALKKIIKIELNYFLINLEVALPSLVVISIKYVPADKLETFIEVALFCTLTTLPVISVILISFAFKPFLDSMFKTSVTGFGYILKFSVKNSAEEAVVVIISISSITIANSSVES